MLKFDSAGHVYTWQGAPVPGVTDVIRSALGDPFANVPPLVLEYKRTLGVAAHLACHLDDAGELDDASVHPEVRPRLEAWRAFRREFPFEVFASERPLYHTLYGYAGTPDRGIVTAASWRAVVDLKTGLPGPAAALQTAAYAQLFNVELGYPDLRRFALQALPSGRYRFVEYTGVSDWRDFLSCLNVHNLKRRIAS